MKVSKSEMSLNRYQNSRPQPNLGRTDMVDNIVNSMFEYDSSNRNIDKIVAQIDEFRENLAMQTKVIIIYHYQTVSYQNFIIISIQFKIIIFSK